MKTPDYLPRAYALFFIWQAKFFARLLEKLNSFKMVEADVKELTARKSKFDQSFERASDPNSANRADRAERKKRTAEYKAEIRRVVNEHLRFNSNISDYDRQYLGLTIVDTTPTPASVPVTHPVLKIDFSQPSRHTLHIVDEEKSGKQKPDGVQQCEVWYRISEEKPEHYSELQYAGVVGKSTFLIEYDSSDEGKKVWYNARWLNTRGQHGPWGAYMSAVIA